MGYFSRVMNSPFFNKAVTRVVLGYVGFTFLQIVAGSAGKVARLRDEREEAMAERKKARVERKKASAEEKILRI